MLHFDTTNLAKAGRPSRPAIRFCAKLLRVLLMLVAMGGATAAAPIEDAVAAYQRGDYATALRRWHPLAEEGDADAQFHLGVMYESGQGVLRSDVEAIKWYRKAAEQGDPVAQYSLGIIYAKGEGASPNHAEAATWYRLAADHGLAGAQFDLGMIYAEGQGVPQDYVQAYMWLNLAASQIPALGKDQRNTTLDARDRLGSKMTPPQLVEARELAFEWTIGHRRVDRLRALLEGMHLNKETPDGPAVMPAQGQAQAGDLQGSPVSSSAAFMVSFSRIGARSTPRRALNLRPSGHR